MQDGSHTFDWKGFAFFIQALAVALVLGTAGYWGVVYAHVYYATPTQASIVATSTPVAHTALPPAPEASQRVIESLTIEDVVPKEGKFIAADLVNMKLYLYATGSVVAQFPIQTKGKPGTPWETPSGLYSIKTKEKTHFSSIGHVYMPYSMQFYGNYFIHGWTHYPDGTPTAASFSGGCIKLLTGDAQEVFEFADLGTKVFVYDNKQEAPRRTLTFVNIPKPTIDAAAFLVADIDTGDVYAERNAGEVRPIASVTKLMTALVANETISLDKKVAVPEGVLYNPPVATSTAQKSFLVNDLFYPLLMQSSNGVAESLASYYGKSAFINWMNATAKSLDMRSTMFADASGISPDNLSSADDLFRLASYLAHKKSFVLKITDTAKKDIVSDDGTTYKVTNVNAPAYEEPFEGGKAGHTTAAQDTMVSVLSVDTDDGPRRIAVIVLGSEDQILATRALGEWVESAIAYVTYQAACTSCLEPGRQIDL